MIIIDPLDEAVRYFIAPRGTAAKDLGTRTLYTDRKEAEGVAFPVGLAVFSVTITVQQITRL